MAVVHDNIMAIHIDNLTISDKNARLVKPSKKADKQLKASIFQNGLIHNLVVSPVNGEGKFEIHAGGRRYKAIASLIEDELLAKNTLIPCRVEEDPAVIAEISLAENTIRAGMHPVDELEAYHRLHVDNGYDVEQLAAHFGKSESKIRKTLALGACHPDLLAKCRDGEFSVDVLRAFTIQSDQEEQLRVYESLSKQAHGIYAYNVRDQLQEKLIPAKSKLVKFVGLEAYKEAGGNIQSDLFHNEEFVVDAGLLNHLVDEKVEAIQSELGEEWSWFEFNADAYEYDVSTLPALQGELTEEGEILKAELADVVNSRQTIEAIPDDSESDEEFEKREQALETLMDREMELEESLEQAVTFTPEQMKESGVIVYLDHHGEPQFRKGVLNKEQAAKQKTSKSQTVKPDYTPNLCGDLEIFKTESARVALIKQPALAVELIHFEITVQMLRKYGGACLLIDQKECRQVDSKQEVKTCKAREIRNELHESWVDQVDQDWLALLDKCQFDKAFTEYLVWPDTLKNSLLAIAAASSLEPDNDFSGFILISTDVHVREHWAPTAKNFFNRIRQETLGCIAAEIMGDSWAEANSNLSKKELAHALEEKCQPGGPGANWIPIPMITQLSGEEEQSETDQEAVEDAA